MKNPELFNMTVAILVKAYMNDTLQHYNCCACAVGNLVAANCNLTYDKHGQYNEVFQWPDSTNGWAAVFCTSFRVQTIKHENYNRAPFAKEQIDSTGYSVEELAKIEFAFESHYKNLGTDAEMHNGLMNVIDALMVIHEATEIEVQQAKELFVKA